MNELYQKLIDCADGRLSLKDFEAWLLKWSPPEGVAISKVDNDLGWTLETIFTELESGHKSKQDCLDDIKVLAQTYRLPPCLRAVHLAVQKAGGHLGTASGKWELEQ